jgi:hypothetical protein
MRRVSTRVLPEPAGARIASGPCGSVTARALVRVEVGEQPVGFGHAPDGTGRVRRDPADASETHTRCGSGTHRLAHGLETRDDPE